VKLYLIWKTLCFRQEHPDLFQQGEYVPLNLAGAKANHVVAFARKYRGSTALVIAPRLVAGLINDVGVVGTDNNAEVGFDRPPLEERIWGDTHILSPCSSPQKYRNVLTGESLDFEGQISVSQVLGEFPVALCVLE
jgi:(1->4)-alpha-D-glucan 1-alpha-D-glucosylmutase